MRGRDLRSILDDIRQALGSSGAQEADEALAKVASALEPLDGQEIGEVLREVADAATAAAAPAWLQLAERLQGVGFNEDSFLAAFGELEADNRLSKADVLRIAERLSVRVDKKATRVKALRAIKGAFFERLYDRDANEMAKRATPW